MNIRGQHISDYTEKDLKIICDLIRATWPTYVSNLTVATLACHVDFIFVARDDSGVIIGVVTIEFGPHKRIYLPWVVVREEWRHRGIGTLIMRVCQTEYKSHEIRLLAEEWNIASQTFYKRLGFIADGMEYDAYPDNDDNKQNGIYFRYP